LIYAHPCTDQADCLLKEGKTMSRKIMTRHESSEVVYNAERWRLLRKFREEAMHLMEILERSNLETLVHGSIARGDVTEKSDLDVFVTSQTSSFAVETALEKSNMPISKRVIVQATPIYAMKAYIETNEKTSVSFPLTRMRKVEREFYRFGGEATLNDLRKNYRSPGVDKRLMLIEPTNNGHSECTILGHEQETAKFLSISVETVFDRVRALKRRDEVGRTGVFVKKELSEDETFELALKRLADQNPAVRRRLTSSS
jgi:predicted nucleotidyltransferase